MKIISSGIIAGGEVGTPLSSCTFPGICILPDGKMIASFKGSPKKVPLEGQNGYLCYSSDGGETWTEPVAPFPDGIKYGGRDGTVRGIYATGIGGSKVIVVFPVVFGIDDLPLYNEETEGILDCDIFYAFSDDYGKTFAEPKRMDTILFNQPTPLTGPVLRLSDGTLICQFEVNKTFYDTSQWIHSSVVIFSKDNGLTWGDAKVITHYPDMYYWDQRIGVMDNDSLLNLFWTFDLKNAEYLTIHASDSVDGGKTWSPLWDTGLPGQPGAPADIGDGRVAAIFIDRSGPPKISVKISKDGGRTFPDDGLAIYDSKLQKQEVGKSSMSDAWTEMQAFSVGHPNLAMLPSGELLAYYYAGENSDRTNICWVKISVE